MTSAGGPHTALGVNINARILLVADQRANQSIMVHILSAMGFWLMDTANNGPAALLMFRATKYDLVIMDGDIEAMGGFAASTRMRGFEEGYRHTPILAVTPHTAMGDRERCVKSGMDEYLTKPLDAAKFRQALLQWIPGDTLLPPLAGTRIVSDTEQRELLTLSSDQGNAALEGLFHTDDPPDGDQTI